MYTRLVTFTGVQDIDGALEYVREKVIPLISTQPGYRGLSISVDRGSRLLTALSLWESEDALAASGSAMAATRQDSASTFGADVTVETFEEVASQVGDPPPGPGSPLMVTRIKMAPEKVDENIEGFKHDVMPRIAGTPGFRGLRNMINRRTGEGMVGTVWADEGARERAAEDALARRPEGMARGVEFGDVSFREIVLVDLK